MEQENEYLAKMDLPLWALGKEERHLRKIFFLGCAQGWWLSRWGGGVNQPTKKKAYHPVILALDPTT